MEQKKGKVVAVEADTKGSQPDYETPRHDDGVFCGFSSADQNSEVDTSYEEQVVSDGQAKPQVSARDR